MPVATPGCAHYSMKKIGTIQTIAF